MADATKIYAGPITALGVAAAGTGDGGSYTDLGYLDQDSSAIITWTMFGRGISDGNIVGGNGLGKAEFHLIQTDPAGIQTTLETYKTTLGKLKITTVDSTNGFHFIDNILLSFDQERSFKAGEVHKFIVRCSLITDNPDDFCSGPKAAS